MHKKKQVLSIEKIFRIVMLSTLLVQMLVPAVIGMIAEAETVDNRLMFFDESEAEISQLEMKANETKLIGLRSTDSEDTNVQISLEGLSLEQNQTTEANKITNANVAYSQEAANVIVSWTNANPTNNSSENFQAAVMEPVIKEAVNNLVWLAVTAPQTGTYTIQANSSRNVSLPVTVSVAEEMVKTPMKELDSVAPDDIEPRNDSEGTPAVKYEENIPFASENYKVSVTTSVWDLNADTWGTDTEITNYQQYYQGKGIKYIVRLAVAEDSDETIVFEVPEQSDPWGGLNKSATLIDPNNIQTTVSFGSMNSYGIKKPTAGIYTLEFVVNFLDYSASVDFDNNFNQEDGLNHFKQAVNVTINKKDELLSEIVTTKAVVPRPIPFSFQRSDGELVDDDKIKFSIVDLETNEVLTHYTYDPENGSIPIGLPEKDFKIVVDESRLYCNSKEYDYKNSTISGVGNYFVTSGYNAEPFTFVLQRKVPDITNDLKISKEVNNYGDLVKSIQTVGYAKGNDSVSIHFSHGLDEATAFNMKLIGDVVLYMLDGKGEKVEEVNIPGSDIWKIVDINNERSGYTMDYEYKLKEPLQKGYKFCMETQWELLEPAPGAGKPNASYDLSVVAQSKDSNGIVSSKQPNVKTVKAYAGNAILAAPKKEVYQILDDTVVEANGKEVKVGEWVRYKIILTAEPADAQKIEENGQIKVTSFTDQLPKGLIATAKENLIIRLNGREVESWDYELDETGLLTVKPDQVLYISKENIEARKLEIEIDIQVGETAIGVLKNVANVETQGRKAETNLGWVWDDKKEMHETNQVTVKVKPDITLEKNVSADKVFPDTPFTYTITGQLNPGSGAMYHGLLTDQLPEGVTAEPTTTRLVVKDAADRILSDQIINDDYIWNKGEKKDHLSLDLTQYLLSPMTLGMTFELTYNAVANVEVIGKEHLVNQAEVSGSDPTKDTEYYTKSGASAVIEVINTPGKLEVEKDVFTKSGSESINHQKVSIGDKVTYTIVVKNSAAAESVVNEIQVEDTVPDGLEIDEDSFTVNDVPVTAAHNLTFPAGSNGFKLDLGDIFGKTEVLISFDVTVTKAANGTLINTAKAEGKVNKTPDGPDEPSGGFSTTANSITPNLTIEKSVGEEGQKEYTATNGATVPYIVIVRNDNGARVIKGQITDTLPEGLAYTSEGPAIYPVDSNATLVVDPNNHTFTYEGFTLEAGGSIRIVYNVMVDSHELSTIAKPRKLVNEATVNGKYKDGEKELEAGSGKDTATIIPVEAPGVLKLTKKADVQMVKSNQEVTYTLVVGNIDEKHPDRSTSVTNVEVTDILDKDLTFVEFLPLPEEVTAEYDTATRTIKIKAGTLKQNESKEIAFKVRINSDSAKVIPNVAEVTGENPPEFASETPPGDKTPPVLLKKLPDPAIKKTVFDQFGKPLDNKTVTKDMIITYKLIVTNGIKEQTGDLFDGTVTDTLPDGLEYVKGSTKINGKQTADAGIWIGNTFSYTMDTDDQGAVAGGTKDEITYEVKVLYATKETELIDLINEAHVKGVDTEKTPYDKKGNTTVTVARGAGKLAIEKNVLGAAGNDHEKQLVTHEDFLFYEIVVTNTETAPSEVQNVTIWDEIPTGLTYQKDSLMIDDAVYDDSCIEGQKLFVNVGLLKNGESKTIKFKVRVTNQTAETIENIAYANGQVRNVTNPTEMTDLPEIKDQAVVMKSPEITFEKKVAKPDDRLINQGKEVTYRLTVSNKKFAGDLLNGTVTDKLPEDLSYVPGTTKVDGETVDDSIWEDSVLTYKLPSPFEGGNTTVIEFRAATTQAGIIENRAVVEGSTSTDEPYPPIEGKTSIKVVTPPEPKLEKSVKKIDDSTFTTISDKLTSKLQEKMVYRLLVTNGTEDTGTVTNMRVTDRLPAELTYVPNSTSLNGKQLPDSIHWHENVFSYTQAELSGGETWEILFTVIQTDISKEKSILNVASFKGEGPAGTSHDGSSQVSVKSEDSKVSGNPLTPPPNKKLPSTGEKKTIYAYLGLMLVSAIVIYYLYRRKSLTRK